MTTSYKLGVLAAIVVLGMTIPRGPVNAETGKLSIHLEPGAGFPLTGWQADELGAGMSFGLKLELPIVKWFGVQAGGSYMQFFKGGHPAGYEEIDKAFFYNGSLGVRFRILNDESGYLFPWKESPAHTGNMWGNLWIDLHADYFYTGDINRFGADVGLGYEFSLVNGMQIGPFARTLYIYQPDNQNVRNSQDGWILIAGLSISVTIPPGIKHLKDTDSDKIFDRDDTCVEDAEDHDGYQDSDGCPDTDNDGDRILDMEDACPMTPEDPDGVEDADGCPDTDNDGDGIPDERDSCPDQAEDKDAFEDHDGCPELDNDGDGILDEGDNCPNEAETVNKVEDEDGCPEADKDSDGFADIQDKCPEEPETVNGVQDDDGCPDKGLVEVQEDRILLGERVYFDRDMSRIKSRSRRMLKQLANLITSHPEYILISIEGHADKRGDVDYNFKLSKKRAERVRDYLISQGIKPERLIFKGYGESLPLIQAATDEETQKNRRVELLIESMDEKLALHPVSPKTKDAVTRTQKAKNLQDFADRLDGKITEDPWGDEKSADESDSQNEQKSTDPKPAPSDSSEKKAEEKDDPKTQDISAKSGEAQKGSVKKQTEETPND